MSSQEATLTASVGSGEAPGSMAVTSMIKGWVLSSSSVQLGKQTGKQVISGQCLRAKVANRRGQSGV